MSNPGAIATSPASMSGVLGVRPPKLVGLSAELRVAPQPATIEDNAIPSTHRRTFTHWTIAPLPDPFKCSSLRPLFTCGAPAGQERSAGSVGDGGRGVHWPGALAVGSPLPRRAAPAGRRRRPDGGHST